MILLDALLSGFSQSLPVFLRVSSFLVAVPIFARGAPALVKVGLAGLITFLLASSLPLPSVPQELAGYLLLCLEEIAVGLALGLMVVVVVSVVNLAGQLIDIPIGFSMAGLFDPDTGMQMPLMAHFHHVVAMMIFFAVDGHHVLLAALARSFVVVPPGAAVGIAASLEVFLRAFGRLFELGLRMALPLVGALFLADVALGIIARMVPQINVFFVGFPFKIGFGVVITFFLLPVYVAFFAYLFAGGGEAAALLNALLRALATTG